MTSSAHRPFALRECFQMGIEPEDIDNFYSVMPNIDEDLHTIPTPYAVADANSSGIGSEQGVPSDIDEETLDETVLYQQRTTLQPAPLQCHDQTDFSKIVIDCQKQNEENLDPHLGHQHGFDLPDLERALLSYWEQFARLGPGGMEHYITIQVWFNDHANYQICDAPRAVRLYDDALEWRQLIVQPWREHVDNTFDIHRFLVAPPVHDQHEEAVAHVILLQRAHPDFHSLLITVNDPWVQHGQARRWAIMMPRRILRQVVVDIMGYHERCEQMRTTCTVRCGERALDDEVFFVTSNGMSIHLQLQYLTEQQVQEIWDNDHMEFLQRKASLRSKPIELVALLDESPPNAAVTVFSMVDFLALPSFIEVPSPITNDAVEQELSLWGHQCHCWIHDESSIAVCWPKAMRTMFAYCYIYIQADSPGTSPPIFSQSDQPRNEIQHMRFLYGAGFHRAALRQPFLPTDEHFQIVYFRQCEPILAEIPGRDRLPWPKRLPCQGDHPFFVAAKTSECRSACRLHIGITADEIADFFHSADCMLCSSLGGIDLPEHVRDAIDACEPVERIDRLLIYCDGSSIPAQRRRPPLRADEEGQGDTWAFLVLAEQYGEQGTSRVNLLGWSAQPVLFDPEAAHFTGSSKIGSETSEREALLWCALWRLAHNTAIPTTFCTDSFVAEKQGDGSHGAAHTDQSYRLLRAVFQSLTEAIGEEALSFSHVAGHSGDPWNDLVDVLAKREREKSFLLPRQTLDCRRWRDALQHLWMIFASDDSVPLFRGDHFDISAPKLPSATLPPQPPDALRHCHIQYQLSFCTANVQSLHTGPSGFSNKTQFLREQMIQHKFNFLGMQETRCAEICGLNDGVLRLGGGADRGHWGVELWVNLSQPFAYIDGKALCLTARDVAVVHVEPRFMITRVVHKFWQAWIVVAHGPQSGQTTAARADWWQRFSQLVANHINSDKLYVLIDANASPGCTDHLAVGDRSFATTKNTPFLRDFLTAQNLCLPCTFDCHIGSTDTWRSPDGASTHCIDFVCIPVHDLSACTLSQVIDSFDLCNGDNDHSAVGLQLVWSATTYSETGPKKSRSFDRSKICKEQISEELRAISIPSWDTDIEQHIAQQTAQYLVLPTEEVRTIKGSSKESLHHPGDLVNQKREAPC